MELYFTENEGRAYPLTEDSSLTFPTDLIVDMTLAAPAPLFDKPLHLLAYRSAGGSVFLLFGTEDGEPVAHAVGSAGAGSILALEGEGVHGYVVLGSGSSRQEQYSVAYPVEIACYIWQQSSLPRVRINGTEYSLPDGVLRINTSGLDARVSGNSILITRAVSQTVDKAPIRSIAGVLPDANGDIRIELAAVVPDCRMTLYTLARESCNQCAPTILTDIGEPPGPAQVLEIAPMFVGRPEAPATKPSGLLIRAI